jgi:hypothetical protein
MNGVLAHDDDAPAGMTLLADVELRAMRFGNRVTVDAGAAAVLATAAACLFVPAPDLR